MSRDENVQSAIRKPTRRKLEGDYHTRRLLTGAIAGTGLDICRPGDTDGGGEATDPVLGSTMGIALPPTRRAVGWWILT